MDCGRELQFWECGVIKREQELELPDICSTWNWKAGLASSSSYLGYICRYLWGVVVEVELHPIFS